MKHGAMSGGRRRAWRAGLTALISLTLVASATVATGLDGESGPAALPASSAATASVDAQPVGTGQPADDAAASAPAPAPATPSAPTPSATSSAPAPETAPAPPAAPSEAAAPAPTPDVDASPEPAVAAPEASRSLAQAPVAEAPAASAAAVGDVAAPGVTPMAVPNPSGNSAVITVKVGGDRTGASSVAGLQGVRLRLHEGTSSGPTARVQAGWAECVSDSSGDCSFVVPETQEEVRECVSWFIGCWEWRTVAPAGVNRDKQFWVVQESAPAGWYLSGTLVTGGATGQQATPYRFRTGSQLRAGSTYRAGSAFMTAGDSSTRTGSSATWQVSRDNPKLAQTCEAGLDVALVLDLSGSVANAGAVGDLKASAIAFAEALEGTGSRLALFTFADYAPRNSTSTGQNYPTLLPVDGNLGTIRSRINGYAAGGGTNWDRGIHQVAQNSQHFDLAIVVTDGLATFSGTSAAGPGNFTRFTETEQAIFSANALKAKGTRLLAVGVGDGINGDAANLRAVSGPTGHVAGASANSADYFQTGWQQLAPLLENLAKGATCQATVTVEKVAQPYGGQPAPAAGWAFATTATGGVVAPTGQQVTGASGEVRYTVRFDRPDAAAATVRIEERATAGQQAAGWNLTGVTCTVNGEGRAGSRDGSAVVLPGVTAGDDVVCTFTNVQTREPGIEIVKQAWDVPSASALDGARELPPGATVKNGTTLTWTYTVRNTGQTALHDIVVTDRPTVHVTCPRTSLEVGQHMVCTGSAAISPGS